MVAAVVVAHVRQVAKQAATGRPAGCGVLCACRLVGHPYFGSWLLDAPGSHPKTHQAG